MCGGVNEWMHDCKRGRLACSHEGKQQQRGGVSEMINC